MLQRFRRHRGYSWPLRAYPLPLTSSQQDALNAIVGAIRDPEAGVILLTGYAGTGKTFTLAALVDELAEEMSLALATPTHKASRCLEKALKALGARVRYVQTVAQVLGQRLHRDLETGDETFVYAADITELPAELLVIDEASMVACEAFERLVEIRQPHQTLLFVGDPAQVPPVKDGLLCPVFKGRTDVHVRLTEVVRHGGPILSVATETRNLSLGRGRYADHRTSKSSVCAYVGRREWLDSFLAAACTDRALGDADFARAVCWTNANVNNLNAAVRRMRYGDDAPPFCEGEVLMAVNAISDPLGGRPLLYSSAEMRVIAAETFVAPVVFDDCEYVGIAHNGKRAYKAGNTNVPPWSFWRLTVDVGHGAKLRFCALDPSERERWAEVRAALKRLARESDLSERKRINEVIFVRSDQFGDVQSAAALTVHKSQGSTFRRVWIHPDTDGFGGPLRPINNRLAYVAITRAAEELHVVADA